MIYNTSVRKNFVNKYYLILLNSEIFFPKKFDKRFQHGQVEEAMEDAWRSDGVQPAGLAWFLSCEVSQGLKEQFASIGQTAASPAFNSPS